MNAVTRAEAVSRLTAPDAPFELAVESVRGTPMRVYAHAPTSLRSIFETSAQHGTRDFLVYRDERYSFAEHARIVAGLAHQLAEVYGVVKGDRVAVAMRNFPEWSFAFWAAQVLGAVAVPLNAWWTGSELSDALDDCGATVAVLDDERFERLKDRSRELPLRAVVRVRGTGPQNWQGVRVDEWETLRGELDMGARLPDVDIGPEDDATILYTSGTTGRAKGAVGTHRNHVTNYLNVRLRNAATKMVVDADDHAVDEAPPSAALATYPFFHISGLNWLYLNAGLGNTLCLQYKWNLEEALQLIESYRIGSLALVPTLLREVLESPLLASHDLSSVRSISSGGGPVPPDLVALAECRLGRHVNVVNGYGLTETTSAVVVNVGGDFRSHPTSIGLPVAVADVRVANPDTDEEVAVGTVGELQVKGPNVVRGYWGNPEATEVAFREGWFRTGDLGKVDADGFLHVVDRLKDVVIRGGENVYCAEVEAAIMGVLGVHDAAVFGVPHATLGEEVAAVVQLAPGATTSSDDLRHEVAKVLAHFKVPAHIVLQTEPLPRSATGKVVKRDLREQFGARDPLT